MELKIKEEKFKVIQFIRELIVYIESNLDNFPKKDIELKNRLRNLSYDLLELTYLANTTLNQESKEKFLEQIVAKIKTLDFLLNLCYSKEIINAKKYNKFGNKMDDIIKYTSGWLKSIKMGHS